MAEQLTAQAMTDELYGLYPDACKLFDVPCGRIVIEVALAVSKVRSGEQTLDEARHAVTEDALTVDRRCDFGQQLVVGGEPDFHCDYRENIVKLLPHA